MLRFARRALDDLTLAAQVRTAFEEGPAGVDECDLDRWATDGGFVPPEDDA